jgi:hypothetical protein
MDSGAIERALTGAEAAVAAGRSLRGTGFWRAVDAVRRDRTLADTYADRIGSIDRKAFENGVKLRVRATVGLLVLLLLTAVGIVAIVLAYRSAHHGIVLWAKTVGGSVGEYPLVSRLTTRKVGLYGLRGFLPIMFLIGLGSLIVGTHSLTHWIVGRLVGMRFTHVFLGGPPPPRPGMKTDYATYLRATPRQRAAMHASGAIVTKIVPFALLPVSLSFYDRWPWITWLLLVIGVVQIVTDVVLSTKVSDWKKVLRELRAASASA